MKGWTGKPNESQPFVKKKSPFIESMCSVRKCCDKYTRLSWYSLANTGLQTTILHRKANHSSLDSPVASRNLSAFKSRMPANPQRKITKERQGLNETALLLSETIGVTDGYYKSNQVTSKCTCAGRPQKINRFISSKSISLRRVSKLESCRIRW